MKITTLRLSNFQSFGPQPTAIDLEGGVTYVLGPNGSGKTAILEALSRLFSPLQIQRRVGLEDFHVPVGQRTTDVHSSGPTLWIEVDLEFPEAGASGQHASVPPNFSHMRIRTADGVPRIRIRLTASLALDGVVDERIEYILDVDEHGQPIDRADMSRYDRGHIEVHYLPARRDPADHVSYTTASLIGRSLRAADWTSERDVLRGLSIQISETLVANGAVSSIGTELAAQWTELHHGVYFTDPSIAFGRGELEGVLRHLTLAFSPSHSGEPLEFQRLSDGQKSLLYISLVLAWQGIARRVLNGEEKSLDPDRLRPPIHTIIALEEPENSLAPQYLGRIVRQLRDACDEGDVQVLIATHAPTLLRRVDPQAICFLRLDADRRTTVHRIVLPDDDQVAAKYVREAVEAYPELYFARLVVLGEGDSEQVVLPRVLAAAGIAEDDASVSVVPLGGRHVNHFWRLLNELQIPHVTLIDLDSGRFQGGWGRISNAANQLLKVRPGTFDPKQVAKLPAWNGDRDFPEYTKGSGALHALEKRDVFFSEPVDLDLMMLDAYPEAYEVERVEPDDDLIVAVLGKRHTNEQGLGEDVLGLFDDYHTKFDLMSKPASHLAALADLDDAELFDGLPPVLVRLVDRVHDKLAELPE